MSQPGLLTSVPDELLNEGQLSAINRVEQWAADRGNPVLTLGGRAGTGKTTIVQKILERLKGRKIAVGAFTGKAVAVLRRKGVNTAQTLHSLLYDVDGRDRDGTLRFKKVSKLPFDLVIVDEGSMVPKDIHEDLLSFDAQVLYVGDHWQLEPIGEDPNLMAKPDIILEEIHRQAADSPILKLATHAHNGLAVFPHGFCPGLEIASDARFWTAIYDADIALVGFNRTRHRVNSILRLSRGFRTAVLEAGERVICLKNNREFGVYNGMTATVTRVVRRSGKYTFIDIEDDAGNKRDYLPTLTAQYGLDSMAQKALPRGSLLFDWGYSLSVHKAQGSEWSKVVIKEEIAQGWAPERWRYTAITRGAQEVIYCQ